MAEDEATILRDLLLSRLDRFEVTLRETTTELRARDEAQAKALDDLRVRMHEMLSGFTVLSNALQEFKSDMLRRVPAIESQVKATFDALMKTNDRVANLEERGTPGLEKHISEYREWVPWLKGWRWFTLILGVAIATAVVGAILWAVGQSGVLVP